MSLLKNKYQFQILCLLLLSACSNQVDNTVDIEYNNTSVVQNTTTTSTQQKNTNWFPDDLTEEEINDLSIQNKLYYFCYPDPTVEECEYEYDGVSLLLWDIGAPFWIEQIAKISNWSQDYGNPGSERWGEYPQELKDILSSPAFKISDKWAVNLPEISPASETALPIRLPRDLAKPAARGIIINANKVSFQFW